MKRRQQQLIGLESKTENIKRVLLEKVCLNHQKSIPLTCPMHCQEQSRVSLGLANNLLCQSKHITCISGCFPSTKCSWWGSTAFMFFKSFKKCLQKKTRIPLRCFQDSASILLEFYLIYLPIFYFKTSIKTSCNQMDCVWGGWVISNTCDPLGYSPPGSSIHGIFWSGLPFPTLEDLPDPGIELTSLASPAPAGGFFTTEPPESKVKVKSLSHVQLFVTPWTFSPLGSSIHGIFQARLLEWVAISFFRAYSQPRDRTQVSCIVGRRFTVWATWEPQNRLYQVLVC